MDSTDSEEVHKFWNSYRAYLARNRIAESNIPRYQRWARWYAASCSGISLRHSTAETVSNFLNRLEKKTDLSEHQLMQILDSVRLLLAFVRSPLVEQLDWEALLDSLRHLEGHQPAGARNVDEALEGAEWVKALASAVLALGQSEELLERHLVWLRRLCRRFSVEAPDSLPEEEVRRYLEELVVRHHVSSSTKNQALAAFGIYFNQVLGRDYQLIRDFKPRRLRGLPKVLMPYEVDKLLENMEGSAGLVAALIYNTGVRLAECLQLRVRDIDFKHLKIEVRSSKNGKVRQVPFPAHLFGPMKAHLRKVAKLHQGDLARGLGCVPLPDKIGEIFNSECKQWQWQWVFPGSRFCCDEEDKPLYRRHMREKSVQKAVKYAAHKAGLKERVSCQMLRHSFAVRQLEQGVDVRTVRELLGHADISSTMIYSEVLEQTQRDVSEKILGRFGNNMDASGISESELVQ